MYDRHSASVPYRQQIDSYNQEIAFFEGQKLKNEVALKGMKLSLEQLNRQFQEKTEQKKSISSGGPNDIQNRMEGYKTRITEIEKDNNRIESELRKLNKEKTDFQSSQILQSQTFFNSHNSSANKNIIKVPQLLEQCRAQFKKDVEEIDKKLCFLEGRSWNNDKIKKFRQEYRGIQVDKGEQEKLGNVDYQSFKLRCDKLLGEMDQFVQQNGNTYKPGF